MAVSDELAAINADARLSDDERRVARHELKCARLATALQAAVGQTITRGRLTITLHSAGVVTNPNGKVLKVRITVLRDGSPLINSEEFAFINPPILAADGTENLARAARDLLEAAVQSVRR